MKHPVMSNNSRIAAPVPALSDGLNRGTDATLIGDKQLSDCCDMQWKDGALRTRTGFVTDLSRQSTFALGEHAQYFTDRDGYLLVLDTQDNEAGTDLFVTVFDKDGVPTGGTFNMLSALGLHGFLVPVGTAQRFSRYTALLFVNNGDIYGVNAQHNIWEPLHDEAYVPLYMTGGYPVVTRAETALTGDRVEPYNMLTEWFRCTYSTDGTGIYYYLPPLRKDSELSVSLTRANSTLDFTVSNLGTVSDTVGGYQVQLDRWGYCFWFLKDGKPVAMENEGVRGNVTAKAQHAYVAHPAMSDMRFGTWYGGDRSTTAGGTRLFLGGGNHVVWSAPADPLYFPATAYATLGDPDESLTAFGKQGELLVLFKEHSLYAVEYVRNGTVTVDEVQSGAVTDITATAVFPITPIHAEIGCDLPQTAALLGNRLVWACKNGTVYTLGTSGQLTQRAVTVISEPIRPLLRQTVPTVAAGVVIDGVYWLLWDNAIFLATDDTSPRWTRFDFSKTGTVAQSLCRVNGALRIPAAYAVGRTDILFWYVPTGTHDTAVSHTGTHWSDAVYTLTEIPVAGMLCTKQFDFGSPDAYKRITRVFADASADGAVSASYLTERGEHIDMARTARDGVRLTPNVTRCRRFALRLAGNGLRVGNVTFSVITGRK